MSAGSDLPIIIAGGGIGGLAAACALARKGFPVRLLEQSAEFREVGAGIQLGPNMFRALEKLGLKQRVLDDAYQPPAQEMRDALSGEVITRIPLGEAYRARFGQPYALTHRADLHAALLAACQASGRVTLENDRRVVDFVDCRDGVTVQLASGEAIAGRALIGCDGMWSRIRERIVGDGPPLRSGHIAYRAVLRRADVPDDLWRPDMALWVGPRSHFVHYPLRRGELFNLVAVFHSDHYVEGWNAEGSREVMWRHFEMQRPEVRRLLERIETWRMWVLCDREPIKQWSRGNVTLLGDAAHPMLQYLAQGACMALEDAVRLADSAAATPDDLQGAFRAYQEQRYLRTGQVQIMARVYGEVYHARGVAAELRNRMLAARTPQDGYEALAWLYEGE